MLTISSINPNSNLGSIQNRQQKPQIKMHSQPMKDTVHFSGVLDSVVQLSKPLTNDIHIFGGNKFLNNVDYPSEYTSIQTFKPEIAKELVEKLNSKVEKINKKLASYEPSQFKEWVSGVLKNKHGNVHYSTSRVGDMLTCQYTKYSWFYASKYLARGNKELLLTVNKLNTLDPKSEILFVGDKRIGEKMSDFIKNTFQKEEKHIYVDNNGEKLLVKPVLKNNVNGIEIVPLYEI
jgi:hypothetical protein